jgi:Fe-S cluster assembly protein SufD
MNLLDVADPRSRDIIEAVQGFKSNSHDVDVDEKFYLNQGLDTFLFVDGVLKHSPQIPGLRFETVTTPFASPTNRDLVTVKLHEHLMGDVYELTIAKETLIPEPVRVLRVSSSGTLASPTLVIRAGKFSKVCVIEETILLDQGNVSVGETHLFADEGAKVEHIQIEKAQGDSKSQGSTFAHVSREAHYANFSFHLAGALTHRSLDLHLNGTGSHGDSQALYLLNGKEKSVIDTVIHHYTPDSTSSQLAKGILDGESRGSFTGRIHIHKDAQRVKSSQLNKNLLLSRKAQVFSEPQLEIFADDVKCSHGSTTGQLSPEEVFYFEARGIPRDRARNLLALGFAMEIVTHIDSSTTRAYVVGLVKDELKNKFNLGVIS